MPLLLSFLTSKAGLAAILSVLVLGVIGVQTARLSHVKAELASVRKADAAAAAEAAQRLKAAQAVSVASQTENASTRVQIVTRYKTLTAKAEALGPEVDADCRIPSSWVALWNEGAQP